jgi:hypothetical protein
MPRHRQSSSEKRLARLLLMEAIFFDEPRVIPLGASMSKSGR